MTRSPRPVTLLLTAVALGTALTACGDSGGDGGLGGGGDKKSSGSSADDWVGALCGALKDLPDHAKTFQSELTEKAQDIATNPKSVQDSFAEALALLGDDFEGGSDALKKAGPPKVQDGEEVQKDVVEALDGVVELFRDAEDKIKETTATPDALGAAALEVGTTIGKGFEEFGDTFEGLDKNDELKKAAEDNADCKKLEDA